MINPGRDAKIADSVPELLRVAELLGGAKVLRQTPKHRLEAHEMILRGLPGKALTHLVGHLVVLQKTSDLEKAVGMSLRTVQRHKSKQSPKQSLSSEQSGRTWKLAEILARATEVFGSQTEAEHWLDKPAMGLDQRRPIELLATPAGVELVEEFLGRLEYGVYG